MSAADADLVRSFYETIEGGDLPGGLALLATDAVWIETAGHPYGGVYQGPDGVRDGIFARIAADFDGFAFDVERVLDGGDAVVGIGTYSATSKATGKPMRARVVHVFRVRDGKIVEFEQFADTHSVREALA